MAKSIKLTYTKSLLDFFDSEQVYDDCKMKIPQFSLMKNRHGGDINLVIGYAKASKGATYPYKYVVVKEGGIRDGALDAHPINKEGLENQEYYVRVSRASLSDLGILGTNILKGDWVMCVAKNRYKGVQLGECLEVMGITGEGRLQFYGTEFTYEPKFFVTIDKTIDLSSLTSSTTTTRKLTIGNTPESIKRGFGPENDDEHPLIRRRRLDSDIQKIRPIYDPKKISRIK